MAYEFWYKLTKAPEATTDGSGVSKHDIECYQGPDKNNLTIVPGRHKEFQVFASDLKTVMDMPDVPQNEKVRAYKDLLVDSESNVGQPIPGWSKDQMTDMLNNNEQSLEQSEAANYYITVVLGKDYNNTYFELDL